MRSVLLICSGTSTCLIMLERQLRSSTWLHTKHAGCKVDMLVDIMSSSRVLPAAACHLLIVLLACGLGKQNNLVQKTRPDGRAKQANPNHISLLRHHGKLDITCIAKEKFQ